MSKPNALVVCHCHMSITNTQAERPELKLPSTQDTNLTVIFFLSAALLLLATILLQAVIEAVHMTVVHAAAVVVQAAVVAPRHQRDLERSGAQKPRGRPVCHPLPLCVVGNGSWACRIAIGDQLDLHAAQAAPHELAVKLVQGLPPLPFWEGPAP